MTATETYQARRQEIDEQIAKLQKHLAELDRKQASAPRDWSFAGSAGHVSKELDDILECFGK